MGYFGGEALKITHQITIDRELSILKELCDNLDWGFG